MPVFECETLPEWPEGYADPLFTHEEMARLLAQPGHVYRMVTQKLQDGTQLEAGHVFARITKGEYADILSLYIRPELRRMGHGQVLMADMLTSAYKTGCKGLTLEVRAGNAGARALYEACGLQQVHVRKGYYADGEDAVVYGMELPV